MTQKTTTLISDISETTYPTDEDFQDEEDYPFETESQDDEDLSWWDWYTGRGA